MKTKLFLTILTGGLFIFTGQSSFTAIVETNNVQELEQLERRVVNSSIPNGYFTMKMGSGSDKKTVEIHIKTIYQNNKESFTFALLFYPFEDGVKKAKLFTVSALSDGNSHWFSLYQTESYYMSDGTEISYRGQFIGDRGKRTLILIESNETCETFNSSQMEFKESSKRKKWNPIPLHFTDKSSQMALNGSVFNGEIFGKAGTWSVERIGSSYVGILRRQRDSQYTASGYDSERRIHALMVSINKDLFFLNESPRNSLSCLVEVSSTQKKKRKEKKRKEKEKKRKEKEKSNSTLIRWS